MTPEPAATARPPVEIQKELFAPGRSRLQKYCDLIIGRRGLGALARYECIMSIAANRSGALGLLLRSRLFPMLLGRCGRNVTFGSHVVLRHPHKISIADNVVIDDYCVLDAKGTSNEGIRIGSGVFLGRNTILSCKNGDIALGDRVNIGFNSEVFSASSVTIGDDALIAAYVYVIGGGHEFADPSRPVLDQARTSHGIEIGARTWLGAGVKVLDGVQIGDAAVVGTGAVVTQSVPAGAVAAGVPARVLRTREASDV
ncbi:MAG TPA: acyltransferase [Vicinamibacterales bacterium]|nr:acyltransferase [Vicinamibacterales bacterium]